MIRTAAFVVLLPALLLPALGDEPKQRGRPAADLLSAGAAHAKEQGKKVFLLFGSPA
jgi:hypothetical protein